MSQQEPVDQVIGIVGNDIVKASNIEQQYLQFKAQRIESQYGDLKCEILEDLLIQKLFIHQARVDSIEVSEAEVEMQLDRRVDIFASQIGSKEELEAYFNKTILEIKDDFRDAIRDQLLTEKMQQEVLGEINITPTEVKQFYKNTSKDSLPLIEGQFEYRQIAVYPPHSENETYRVREQLLNLRERIINGENFATLAVLYSEGPSASQGGELGYMTRGQLDPAYASAAFTLQKGGVSRIVESDFGYHLIQLIDKKDNAINTRHIILKPKISEDAALKATERLDSIRNLLLVDSIAFKTAAILYSEDKKSKISGGLAINANFNSDLAGTSRFLYRI
ncbi:MAG: peptidylprolyl isomerase [Bacteroidales bacterium]|nr:peptidylprolyl isomerase [Bacteroidales bacterium]